MDPVGVLLGKIDKETNQNKPEGSLPMEGALFEVKFYAGVQMDRIGCRRKEKQIKLGYLETK